MTIYLIKTFLILFINNDCQRHRAFWVRADVCVCVYVTKKEHKTKFYRCVYCVNFLSFIYSLKFGILYSMRFITFTLTLRTRRDFIFSYCCANDFQLQNLLLVLLVCVAMYTFSSSFIEWKLWWFTQYEFSLDVSRRHTYRYIADVCNTCMYVAFFGNYNFAFWYDMR